MIVSEHALSTLCGYRQFAAMSEKLESVRGDLGRVIKSKHCALNMEYKKHYPGWSQKIQLYILVRVNMPPKRGDSRDRAIENKPSPSNEPSPDNKTPPNDKPPSSDKAPSNEKAPSNDRPPSNDKPQPIDRSPSNEKSPSNDRPLPIDRPPLNDRPPANERLLPSNAPGPSWKRKRFPTNTSK